MEQALTQLAKAFVSEVAGLLVIEAKKVAAEPRNIPIHEAVKMSGMPRCFLKHAIEKKPGEEGFLQHFKLPDPAHPGNPNRNRIYIRTDDLWEWMRQFQRK